MNESDSGGVVLSVGDETVTMDRATATRLRTELGVALAGREEFTHTVSEYRQDGTYVVARRGADSSGHRKVFEGFDRLRERYRQLPAEFTAADLGESGLSGSRRHMVLRHYAEHPAFPCELVSRQPLTVRKRRSDGESGPHRSSDQA